VNVNDKKGLEIRGGITSMNVNLALSPPGASKATIEVIAPQYKGLHEDYYITMPNGTRMPYFAPMMEVKIYMKGRFLDEATNYRPQYYPVFWGLITEVTESYSGGVSTFSLGCSDILSWWKVQKITLKPSALSALFGAPSMNKFPTVFENMTPWEVIYALFLDSFFVSDKGNAYNFIYPKLSKSGFTPDFGELKSQERKDTFTALTLDVIKYWDQRFGFNLDTPIADPDRAPLEMFGLQGPISLESVREAVSTFRSTARLEHQSNIRARLTLDFGILARIQPYGAFNLFGDGATALESTKLEIANEVCEQTHMEFFVDSNGRIVFKPPLYNLDVNSEGVPHYIFKPEDIISFTSSVNSDTLVNYLEVTAPVRYEIPELENIGYHIDFDSVKRFGLRYQSVAMRYGNDAKSLRLVACAEMTRINSRAFTGSLSTPLRPEMRLGYPIYVKHVDAYYYVTSISHSLSFGSSATTDLGLESRRDRVWDDGSVTGTAGRLLKGKVLRFKPDVTFGLIKKNIAKRGLASSVDAEGTTADKIKKAAENIRLAYKDAKAPEPDNKEIARILTETEMLVNDMLKEDFKRTSGVLSGPYGQGFYDIDDASIKTDQKNETGEQIVDNQDKAIDKKSSEDAETDSKTSMDIDQRAETMAIVSNELLMVTDDTVPYTDRLGYKHIGAFPYGANLKVMKNNTLSNSTNPKDRTNASTNAMTSASGTSASTSTSGSSENASEAPGTTTPSQSPTSTNPEEYNRGVEERKQMDKQNEMTPNPDNNPEMFQVTTANASNLRNAQQLNTGVNIQLGAAPVGE